MPPLAARGSSLRRSVLSAPEAMKAPIWPSSERFERPAQELAHQLGGAFGGLERDIAGEAVGHHHIHGALRRCHRLRQSRERPWADCWRAARRICGGALAPPSLPFCSSAPTLSRPTLGWSRPRMAWAKASPITAKSTSCSARGADIGAAHPAPRSGRAGSARSTAMAGREMPSMMPSWNMRHRHQRAGIAGGDRDIGLAVLHAFDGVPHAGVPAAAQHMAGLVLHRDPVGRMAHAARDP